MRPVLLLATCAALALGASHASAAAVINFPPAGTRSFIALYEIDSGLRSCPQVQCTIVSSLTATSTLAPVTFTGSNPADFITASGSTGGDALHGFVRGRDAGELDVVLADTYTVHGGTGPFSITAMMNVEGTASSITLPLGSGTIDELLAGSATGKIGQLDIDPAALIPTVDAFVSASSGGITRIGAPASVPFSFPVSYTQTVSPGQTFDLAYELQLGYAIGQVDASNTAHISFILPDGVFLTSAGGATFGTPPVTGGGGVPEPASWALMIMGFGLAGATLRGRARRAA